METYDIHIVSATTSDTDHIVRLIMTAMTDDCCLYYAGNGRTLDDFARVLRRLVTEEHSQYSYRNTLLAVGDRRTVLGACVAYDGGELHRLREAFFAAMREEIGRTFDRFDDETAAGEYYIDSLAVYPEYRRRGIASMLLRATCRKAQALGLTAGLLVDTENPNAERMYTALGFRYVEDSRWGGRPMHHLQHRRHALD